MARSHSYEQLHSQDSGIPLPDNRRSRFGLGSSIRWDSDVRFMDQDTRKMAFQHEGIVCSLCSNQKAISQVEGVPYSVAVRQPHCSCVYQKGRRHEIDRSVRSNFPIVRTDRSIKSDIVGILPSRKVQRDSRSTVSEIISSRVASVTSSDKRNFRKVGYTGNRPLRIIKVSGSGDVRIDRLQRSIRKLHRCIQSTLGVQASLGFSTSHSHAQSFSQVKQEQGDIYCDSTKVGPNILDDGSGQPNQASTNNDQESQRSSCGFVNKPSSSTSRAADLAGVENWVWGERVRNWSEQERDLVKGSWRKSTLGTYKAPIERWINWCQDKGVNPKEPKGEELARFLANLHIGANLAYSTILVHKSAILICASRGAENLSSDFLVRQVLKSVSVARPKESHAQIWDAQILFDWLLRKTDNFSFFEVSRRVATILLLASGRRIHDLTLLKISKNLLVNRGEEIVFWPAFESKTDRATFRQSGWKLTKHPIIWVCPIVWIRVLLKKSEERRIGRGLDELFITVTGQVKPASRTIISGWIRSVLKEAGIDASPGSVRAAVASKGWLENLPVQEILDIGNWRCAETFRNHYCKELRMEKQGSQKLLFNNFNPV